MSLNLANDWQVIDDPITVTLYQKTGEGQYDTGTQVQFVYKQEITKFDILKMPALLEQDSSIHHMWAAKLGGKVPKLGDQVVDADGSWIVKKVEKMDRDANGVQRYVVYSFRSTRSP